MRQLPERDAPSAAEFRTEIVPRAQPMVFRGVADHWPLVIAANQGPHRCMAMLEAHATDADVEILRTDPGENGRFHYAPDGRSLNFVRGRASLSVFLAALREQEASDRPYSLVIQGVLAETLLPNFKAAHPLPLASPASDPRLWVGNAAKVATHNDPTDNIAVVAAGRRRFTLFPPEAEPELYMGPSHPTPAGTPVSMVHVTAPDLDRYPLFQAALEKAQEAELGPGDAIFIPHNWYHHVEALEPFNVLVNYWEPPQAA